MSHQGGGFELIPLVGIDKELGALDGSGWPFPGGSGWSLTKEVP